MSYFGLTRHENVARVTFSRPPRNLMSMAAMSELEGHLRSLADDDTVAVIVITSDTPGYFVAHADVEDLTRLGRGEAIEGDPAAWGRAFELLDSMPQPVVAAVNGQAWGGGCELSLACTVRVAAEAAHFAQPEVAVGIIPGAGGTQRLPRLVGPGRAAELILSGRIIDAHEAERIGLVQAVLPDVGFQERVLDWVAPMAAMPRAAVTAAKQAVVAASRLPLDEGLALEGRLFLACQTRDDTLARQDETVRRYRDAADDEHLEL